MLFRLAADSVVVLHLGFILFVVVGGLMVWRWRRLIWVHSPAAIWGVFIEVTGGVCPLTPLENRFRTGAGDLGYSGGFVEQYLIPIVYPAGLTLNTQVALGIAVMAVNFAVYGMLIAQRMRKGNEES